jgi:GT2 family glycosyltransferase
MTPALRLSVVVVSIGRPRALLRCLRSLSQLLANPVEVIVVTDEEGRSAARSLPFAERLHLLAQDTPNIARARNTGVAAASGDVVAFIDDDAVAEPVWADAILSAFGPADVQAVTGPVLGRNGISLQWGRMATDTFGHDTVLADGQDLGPGHALKLHGTNMAFRRDLFDRLGGFDPAFHFYLEDTDFARRVADAGDRSVYVENAVVHHGFAASARRTEDRVPLSLFDIGASTAVFLRKHAPGADHGIIYRRLEADQRARLLRFARKRQLDPEAMRRLMESLQDGFAEGQQRVLDETRLTLGRDSFRPVRDAAAPAMHLLAGWSWQSNRLRAEAARHVAEGDAATVFLFEPTPRKHKVVFTDLGWWEHRGGIYGPAERTEPRVQMSTRAARTWREAHRVADLRGFVSLV